MEEYKKDINTPLMVLVAIQILFVVLLAMSLSELFSSNKIDFEDIDEVPKISVEHLGESMPGASSNDIKMMELTLLDAVNENMGDVNFGANKGILREDSVKTYYFENANLHYFSAIVDIPGLGQSYWIFHEYSDDKMNESLSGEDQYMALCLVNEENMIYRDFDCKSRYAGLTYNAIAAKYLKYTELYKDNLGITVSDDYRSIEIDVRGKREKSDEEYVDIVKNKLDSLGISPGIFEYTVVDSDLPAYMDYVEQGLTE